jgi:cytochrome P450 family 4
MYNFIQRSDFIFRLTPTYRKQQKLLKTLHDFTDNVIREKRKKIADFNNNLDEYESEIGEKKKMALLDVLLLSTINGEPLSDMDIREEVDTFMLEGHDTTTSGIAFTLYHIAKRPEIQAKIFDEILCVIGDDVTKPVSIRLELIDLTFSR